jgi:hypothetical protein
MSPDHDAGTRGYQPSYGYRSPLNIAQPELIQLVSLVNQ